MWFYRESVDTDTQIWHPVPDELELLFDQYLPEVNQGEETFCDAQLLMELEKHSESDQTLAAVLARRPARILCRKQQSDLPQTSTLIIIELIIP